LSSPGLFTLACIHPAPNDSDRLPSMRDGCTQSLTGFEVLDAGVRNRLVSSGQRVEIVRHELKNWRAESAGFNRLP
jgi:hypothetical protein